MAENYRPILLVEDNPMDIDLTKRAFGKLNIPVPIQIARDGETALAYISKWDEGEWIPWIILLDLKLPRVDGLEVLRVMKAHPRYRKIPVIVLSSSSDSGDIANAYQLGANSYIIKPVDFDEFMEVVAMLHKYWCCLNIQPGI